MAVSGMVVTLSADQSRAGLGLAELRAHPAIEVGPLVERKLAVTAEAEGSGGGRDLLEWIERLPGVEHVDVVFIELADEPAAPCATGEETRHEPGPH